MKLKVLELEPWMENDIHPDWRCGDKLLGSDRYPEVRPVFNRPGVYLLGKQSWIEIEGKAYANDPEQFRFELRWKLALEYTEQEYQALRAITKTKLATEKQHRIYYDIVCARECRDVGRRSRKYMLSIFRESKELSNE